MFDKVSSWPACRTQKAAYWSVLCLVIQSCPTLYNPMDCSLPGSSVHRDSSGKNTGVGCHALLQGNFPTLGLNTGLPFFIMLCLLSSSCAYFLSNPSKHLSVLKSVQSLYVIHYLYLTSNFWQFYPLTQSLANFFLKGPASKCFRLCKP